MSYNRGYHSSIKMSPIDAEKPENELTVRIENEKRFAEFQHKRKSKPKFKIGDHCRISLNKSKFSRGYKQKYSTEVFKVRLELTSRFLEYFLIYYSAMTGLFN